MIHPYLGFVYNPEVNSLKLSEFHGSPISQYGFIDNKDPIFHKSDNEVVIGIFGGSFAYWFSVQGIESFISEVKKSPYFFNKEITIVRFALGGLKQPQQLLTLAYFLGLGAKFDIVINLDGFNDIALPITDNMPKHVYPFYPRNWFTLMNELPNSSSKALAGEIGYLQEKREKWAGLYRASRLRYSFLVKFLWLFYDTKLAQMIQQKQLEFLKLEVETENYALRGPQFSYASAQELYQNLARLWHACSFQMHKLCKANNILYYHFLQPNQYVLNTKELSSEELRMAYSHASPYRAPVQEGYPYLQNAGAELIKEKVNFYDLTQVFSNHKDAVYSDSCCHITKEANAYLGAIIGEVISQAQAKNRE